LKEGVQSRTKFGDEAEEEEKNNGHNILNI